ncbi:MAG TPA: DNA primase [Beijerinckiaceae bacterium]|jgi:DNA primase|nr:DNA primase [Beijerinckiaceae bacterium]
MRFSPSFLDEIRARLPVSEVARQRVRLKKEGREWRGLSPFNPEKTPSFFVNDQKGFFHDFSSGKHGDAFKFVMDTEGVSFPEAVERLAAMAGLPLPTPSPEQDVREKKRASLVEVLELATQFFEARLVDREGVQARTYLAGRQVTPALQKQFRLGYSPADRYALRDHLAGRGIDREAMIETGLLVHGEDIAVPYDRFRERVIFPIQDRSGRVIAFGGRAMEKEVQAKYLNSPETPLFHKGQCLYNHHRARKAAHETGRVVVVEGYMDVIGMAGAGIAECVAPLGTALTPEQCELLWRMAEEPILCFDGDKAGRKAAYRAIDTALPLMSVGRSMRFALLPEGMDPDDLARSSGPAGVADLLNGSLPLVELLWMRETEGHVFDTPERRAALEQRIAASVQAIRDVSLRRHYEQEMWARLRRLFDNRPPARAFSRRTTAAGIRFGRKAGPPLPGASIEISPTLSRSPMLASRIGVPMREALILLILLNHPTLIGAHAEDLAQLDLASPEARRLRDFLIRHGGEIADAEELAAALDAAGFEPVRRRLQNLTALSSLWSVRPDASDADSEATLKQALVLHRRFGALHTELQKAEAALAREASEHNLAKLRDIQAQLSALEGTEAVIEGFGEASGRHRRDL